MKIPVHPVSASAIEKFQFDFDLLQDGALRNLSSLSGTNFSWIINASRKVEATLIDKFTSNRNVDGPAFWLLIVLYSVLIVFGAAGNGLVVLAVARKPAMRTARNMFIVNLAVSDLLLCLVTTPLTLMEVLSKHFPLGRQAVICKLIGTLQATSIFVSTISITAIALDRYQVIIYPTRESLQVMGAVSILTVIWLLAIILASPMFIYRTLKTHTINLFGIDTISFCLEEWPIKHGRAYYSAFSLIVQYLLPIIVVSAAYLRIYFKLKYRYVSTNLGGEAKKERERGRRMHRTNSLLISIAVIYCISWLPLNFFNLYADLITEPPMEQQTLLIMYAICHLMGMSSACSNPLLYGWLNDNFRKEFKEILNCGRSNVDERVRTMSRRRNNAEMSHGVRLEAMSMRKCSEMQDTTENGMHLTVADTEMTILAR